MLPSVHMYYMRVASDNKGMVICSMHAWSHLKRPTEAAPAFEKWSGHCKKKDRSCMCTVGGEARKCRTRGSLRDAPDARCAKREAKE